MSRFSTCVSPSTPSLPSPSLAQAGGPPLPSAPSLPVSSAVQSLSESLGVYEGPPPSVADAEALMARWGMEARGEVWSLLNFVVHDMAEEKPRAEKRRAALRDNRQAHDDLRYDDAERQQRRKLLVSRCRELVALQYQAKASSEELYDVVQEYCNAQESWRAQKALVAGLCIPLWAMAEAERRHLQADSDAFFTQRERFIDEHFLEFRGLHELKAELQAFDADGQCAALDAQTERDAADNVLVEVQLAGMAEREDAQRIALENVQRQIEDVDAQIEDAELQLATDTGHAARLAEAKAKVASLQREIDEEDAEQRHILRSLGPSDQEARSILLGIDTEDIDADDDAESSVRPAARTGRGSYEQPKRSRKRKPSAQPTAAGRGWDSREVGYGGQGRYRYDQRAPTEATVHIGGGRAAGGGGLF